MIQPTTIQTVDWQEGGIVVKLDKHDIEACPAYHAPARADGEVKDS